MALAARQRVEAQIDQSSGDVIRETYRFTPTKERNPFKLRDAESVTRRKRRHSPGPVQMDDGEEDALQLAIPQSSWASLSNLGPIATGRTDFSPFAKPKKKARHHTSCFGGTSDMNMINRTPLMDLGNNCHAASGSCDPLYA